MRINQDSSRLCWRGQALIVQHNFEVMWLGQPLGDAFCLAFEVCEPKS